MKEEGLAETVGLAMGKTDLMLEIIKDWPFDAIINHNRFTILNRNADELYNMLIQITSASSMQHPTRVVF